MNEPLFLGYQSLARAIPTSPLRYYYNTGRARVSNLCARGVHCAFWGEIGRTGIGARSHRGVRALRFETHLAVLVAYVWFETATERHLRRIGTCGQGRCQNCRSVQFHDVQRRSRPQAERHPARVGQPRLYRPFLVLLGKRSSWRPLFGRPTGGCGVQMTISGTKEQIAWHGQ